MKSILSHLLIILPFLTFSQNAIVAEYSHTSRTSNIEKSKSIVLYANNERAKQIHSKSQINDGNEYGASLNNDGSITIIEEPSDYNNVWFYKASTNDVIKSVKNPKSDFIVYDTGLDYNWEIKDEIDSIGNYQVVKALTNFRGRTFTAWFAPAIPISFGPWKLKGLPGLILKMYDQEQKYTWSVRKINLNAEFTEDALKPTISEDAEGMTYREGLELSDKLRNEKSRIRNTKLGGRGTSFKTVRHREQELEREFEWEEN